MKYAGLLIIVFVVTFGYTQPPDTLWTKTYGGTSEDYGNSVIQTSDGGYIIAGVTRSYGSGAGDVYIIKTDASGDTLWTKTYGTSVADEANSIIQTMDGGYFIAGTYERGSYSPKVWLIKTDASGDTLWTKIYGDSEWVYGYCAVQTADSGYAIMCGGEGGFGLIKTDASGDTLWTKIYGGSCWPPGRFCSALAQTTDGGYILTGIYDYGGANRDVYLIKTDLSGDTLWTKTYGDTLFDFAGSVAQTDDGGYIVAGTKNWGIEAGALYLIKTDASGDTLWTKTCEGWSGGSSVIQTTDGGYIVVGNWGYDIYIVRTDASGDTLWTKVYYEYEDTESWGSCVAQTTDGGYIITGGKKLPWSYSDVWLLKLAPEVGVQEQPIVQPIEKASSLIITIFRGPLQIPEGKKCRVFDILGRIVAPNKIQPGIYFIEVDGVVTQKVIKVR